MTSRQASLAFKDYKRAYLEDKRKPDLNTVRDAFEHGYELGQKEKDTRPIPRAKLLWFMGAIAFSLGLWWLIYLGLKLMFFS